MKWKSDIFDIIPKPIGLAIGILYAVGFVEILIGVGYSIYIGMDDGRDFSDFKTEIIWSYCLGIGAMGLAMVLMGATVFMVNIDRHRQGLSTYSPNKHGKAEGGNFYYNQGINLLFIGLGVYLIYLMALLLWV